MLPCTANNTWLTGQARGRNGSDCEAEKHVVTDVGSGKSVSMSELRCGREVG